MIIKGTVFEALLAPWPMWYINCNKKKHGLMFLDICPSEKNLFSMFFLPFIINL